MPAATAIRTHGKNPDQPEEGIDGYGKTLRKIKPLPMRYLKFKVWGVHYYTVLIFSKAVALL